MKQIEFKTSKGTFIISDERYYLINENGVRVAYLNNVKQFEFDKFMHLPLMTEEQASEIVDKVMNGQHFQNYNYKCITDRWVKTGIESLHSLIKSLGVHLYKNPAPLMHNHRLEAESKTFYNPYIFKKI